MSRTAVPIVLVAFALLLVPETSDPPDLPRWPERLASAATYVRSTGSLVADGTLPSRVDDDGTLTLRSSSASMSLRLAAIGRRAMRGRGAHATDGVATVDHGDVHEWVVSTRDGLEHGFDLARRPGGGADVSLRIAVDGGRAVQDGADVLLVDDADVARFGYRELAVFDARGSRLRSEMIARGDAIELLFDDASAVYPVRVDPIVLTVFETIAAAGSDREVDAQCGFSVAIRGNLAVVGCPADDATGGIANAGAVLVFSRASNTGPWMPAGRLVAPVPTADARFGHSVAFDGTSIAVGAPGMSLTTKTDAGLVYVFRNSTTWSLFATIFPGRSASSGGFGWSVAVAADLVVVGAPNAALLTDTSNVATGVVAGYSFAGGVVTPLGEVNGPSPADGDRFGDSVAMRGSTVVIGAPRHEDSGDPADSGAAYVYSLNNGALFLSDLDDPAPTGSGRFGADVALSSAGFVVGKPHANTSGGGSSGAALVYDTSRAFAQQLVAADGGALDFFGFAVAMDGESVLVGAAGIEMITTTARVGSAYLYVRDGNSWVDVAKLLPSDAAAGDANGFDVALDAPARTAVIGVPRDTIETTARAGSAKTVGVPAYHFLRVTVVGSGQVDSTPEGITCGARCVAVYEAGESISLVGTPFAGFYLASVTGACDDEPCDVELDSDREVTYTFSMQHGNGTPCDEDEECTSDHCVDGVCCNESCGDGEADCEACSVAAGAAANGSCGALVGERPASVVCRDAVDLCDRPERCVAGSRSCPADAVMVAGTECRPAQHPVCDVAETCDGSDVACPMDVVETNEVSCDDGRACNGSEACDGLGACVSSNPVVCPDDGNPCTADLCLDGIGCASVAAPGCVVVDGGAVYPDADGGTAAQPDLRGAGGCTCDVSAAPSTISAPVAALILLLARWVFVRRMRRELRPRKRTR